MGIFHSYVSLPEGNIIPMKTNHHEPANSRTIKNPIQKLVESVFHPFFCFFFKAIALGVLASRWPQDLFSQKSHLQGDELRVWASFVEIYNEQCLAGDGDDEDGLQKC